MQNLLLHLDPTVEQLQLVCAAAATQHGTGFAVRVAVTLGVTPGPSTGKQWHCGWCVMVSHLPSLPQQEERLHD